MVEANPSSNVESVAARQGATKMENLDSNLQVENYGGYVYEQVSARAYNAADAGDAVV